ncbi:zf-HC2 domain-containing protein [Massilia sp. DJPM01]|uniref:anti-sigma factor family protein n=1 Tax=Massilia sp. DJPM01 TaxID=3024404 RepID=UPI00259EC954|nr:zf-HC2 domain-containing protein [Massilia sp. DJPM01]MDM5182143.1 zf-HC2 domain-containing protein [Massilia sp. DJPM01]
MPNCREVHRLVSERMDRTLTLRERSGVGVHLMLCRGCTRFEEQMQMLRRAMRQVPPDDAAR